MKAITLAVAVVVAAVAMADPGDSLRRLCEKYGSFSFDDETGRQVRFKTNGYSRIVSLDSNEVSRMEILLATDRPSLPLAVVEAAMYPIDKEWFMERTENGIVSWQGGHFQIPRNSAVLSGRSNSVLCIQTKLDSGEIYCLSFTDRSVATNFTVARLFAPLP